MTIKAVGITLMVFLFAPGILCAAARIPVKFKEEAPIKTAYEYELARAKAGEDFEVQESRGATLYGFYPTETGGIRGYVLLKHIDVTDELSQFIRAEAARRGKLKVGLDRKAELSKLPQPPGKRLTKYVEDKAEDFTSVSGVMLESTTWTKDKSPYLITGPVYVPSGVILFIDPGVEIYSEKSKDPRPRASISSGQVNGILIAGNILAIGRPDQIISFRGLKSDPSNRTTWGGIHVLDGGDPGSIFRWVIIENAATGISSGSGPVVSNCIFRYNYSGILLNERSDTANIFNNLIISNNTGLEARGTPSTAEVYNNIFAYNQPNGGIRAWKNAEPLIAYNDMYANNPDYQGWSPYSTDMRVNPMFVDAKNGDYHVYSRSPLLGRGRGGSNIGLYPGRDAVHVPRETTIEEEKGPGEGEGEEKKEEKPGDTKKKGGEEKSKRD